MENLELESAIPTRSNPLQEMHRMLAVHEIVSNILQKAQRRDQAVAARVSSLWRDIAVDWLWRELDSVLPLLTLLAPLAETSTGLAFAERIEPQKWERFRYYSQKVRRLHHDDSDWDSIAHLHSCSLSSDASAMLVALKPAGFGALLPHVQEIHWEVRHDVINLQHVLPFLYGSLKTLRLAVDDIDTPDYDDAIALFLDSLWAIQDLSLETFSFDIPGPGMPTQILRSLICFLQSQPTIKFFDCDSAPKSDVAQGLFYQSFPEDLHGLSTTVSVYGPTDYLAGIQTLVKRTPKLRTLKLDLRAAASWWPSTFDDLSPLLALSNLEELNLTALQGFHLDPDDIVILGKSFNKMARIHLPPVSKYTSGLGIQATSLIDFAMAFPNLQSLGIHIEWIKDPLQLPWKSTEQNSQALAQVLPSFNPSTFQLLYVGWSLLEDRDIIDMAELLSVLCRNPSFEITCRGKETYKDGSARAWRKVEALVKHVQGVEQDTARPYDEWCRALILEKVASDQWPEGK
ncbi:hypothetical protein FRC00_013569 [Tulasnella sp. 408]|nr:hypothetical protein FRC00_013569 [Tulasnella sp. 408]